MLKNTLTMALKVLLRRKFFTFASLFGISFTLMVLLVATAVLDHLLAPAPPESQLERTLYVGRMVMRGESNTSGSEPGFRFLDQYARNLPGVERMSIVSTSGRETLYRDGARLELTLRSTDAEYWKILDHHFLEGGPYTAEDDRSGARVAVISARARDRLFDGESALGKTLQADRQSFRVVGVVDNVSYLRDMAHSDLWVPLGAARSQEFRRGFQGGFEALLLCESAAHRQQVKNELAARLPDVPLPDPDRFDELWVSSNTRFEQVAADILPARDGAPQPSRLLAALVVGALLFMLLPSLNLINLNLSRTLERSSEIGVRRAFGAPSGTLMLQFLIENVVLTLLGAGIGLLLSTWVLKMLNSAALVPHLNLGLNPRVFAWGLGLALLFGFLSGIFPAWKMSRLRPAEALRARTSR